MCLFVYVCSFVVNYSVSWISQKKRISLDAKIISKVIASRIKNVFPYIIHSNQTGYVKDRYIG